MPVFMKKGQGLAPLRKPPNFTQDPIGEIFSRYLQLDQPTMMDSPVTGPVVAPKPEGPIHRFDTGDPVADIMRYKLPFIGQRYAAEITRDALDRGGTKVPEEADALMGPVEDISPRLIQEYLRRRRVRM